MAFCLGMCVVPFPEFLKFLKFEFAPGGSEAPGATAALAAWCVHIVSMRFFGERPYDFRFSRGGFRWRSVLGSLWSLFRNSPIGEGPLLREL